MAQGFLTLVNGVKTLTQAIIASAGAGDSGKIIAADAAGRIDNSFMPVGIGADTKSISASEALSAGNIINVFSVMGSAGARKADASAAGKDGIGFVLAGVAANANATVYFEGTITGLTGLTVGTKYFLSPTTPGGLVTAPANPAAGQIVQLIGTAISATELSFEPDVPILIA